MTLLSPIDYTAPVLEKEIKKLELQNGLVPFDEWFDSLRDRKMQAAVDARLALVRAGNFGDHKSVGGGVSELRIALGPGLRVYTGCTVGRSSFFWVAVTRAARRATSAMHNSCGRSL